MTGRSELLFLKFAWLLTLLVILCPAPNAGDTPSTGSNVWVPFHGSIPLKQMSQFMAASSITQDAIDEFIDLLRKRTWNQPKTYAPLPEGYAQYLNSTVAYKIYTKDGSWMETNELCEKDGARLAIADNTETYAYFQNGTGLKTNIGIYRSFDNWISVRDGSIVNNVPWVNGQPDMNYGCVRTSTTGGLLETVPCERRSTLVHTAPYVCELPIPKNTQ